MILGPEQWPRGDTLSKEVPEGVSEGSRSQQITQPKAHLALSGGKRRILYVDFPVVLLCLTPLQLLWLLLLLMVRRPESCTEQTGGKKQPGM